MEPKYCDFCGEELDEKDLELGVEFESGEFACLKCREQSSLEEY